MENQKTLLKDQSIINIVKPVCRTCRFHGFSGPPDFGPFNNDICKHDRFEIDVISGRRKYRHCEDERKSSTDNKCGPNGIFFEPILDKQHSRVSKSLVKEFAWVALGVLIASIVVGTIKWLIGLYYE